MESNYEQLEKFLTLPNEGGRLERVFALTWKLDPEDRHEDPACCIELELEECFCLIRAVAADDTVEAHVRARPDAQGGTSLTRWERELLESGECDVRQITNAHPWSRLVGRPLIWAWAMRNHRASSDDGVQIRFGEDVVQLVTIASSLVIYLVTRLNMAFEDSGR